MLCFAVANTDLLNALSQPQAVLALGLLAILLLAALIVLQLTTEPRCRHCGYIGRRAEFAGRLCPRCRRQYNAPPGSPILGPVTIDDVVRVHLTTTRLDGELVESTHPGEPRTVTVRTAQRTLRESLIGMRAGDSRTMHLPVGFAYGGRRPDRVLTLHYGGLRNTLMLVPGRRVEVQKISRDWVAGTVAGFKPSAVRLDTNHPLAGKELIYQIELIEILSHPPF